MIAIRSKKTGLYFSKDNGWTLDIDKAKRYNSLNFFRFIKMNELKKEDESIYFCNIVNMKSKVVMLNKIKK